VVAVAGTALAAGSAAATAVAVEACSEAAEDISRSQDVFADEDSSERNYRMRRDKREAV